MKKTILLLVAIIAMVACGKGDDNSSNSSKKFNPPAWIQGSWLDAANVGYKFEADNFCWLLPAQELCFNRGIYVDQVSDVKEQVSDKTYSVSFLVSNATKYSFVFTKISNNQISSNQSPNTIFTKR
ncbi:hypothetical protein [Capnocytophaga sp. oral taxon 878]|uniref:hypothetical protein n=1 Tax=Capnocytophaga sp. oral taxon 878 TaxID=1316596 RepID=UPI000D043E3A|nr:hypothetical protein [Capnocytophaga sp. oral taxon 878]AVM49041.1 hypothetical protein C4H12_00350 [Capnocytophaga sp. oral taxon 878]